MAATGKKWLLGCGAGCLLVILLIVGLAGSGALLFKDSFTGWRTASSAQEELRRTFGAGDAFAPAWDGGLSGDRIEAFLAVQAQTAAIRSALSDQVLAVLGPPEEDAGKAGRFLRRLRALSHVSSDLAQYVSAKAEALLAAEMNPGEFHYLHSLVYHCWLGYDPGAGASDFGRIEHRGSGGFSIHIADDDHGDGDPQRFARQLRSHLNQQHQRWLRAMLAAAPLSAAGAEERWRQALRDELALLEAEPQTVPWVRSFPASWQTVLAPYRERLVANWDERSNPLESNLGPGLSGATEESVSWQ